MSGFRVRFCGLGRCSFAVLGGVAPAARGWDQAFVPILAPRTAFVSKYRGDQQRVLAKAPWGQVTESDLFLFLLMTGVDDPLLVEKFREAQTEEKREDYRARIEARVRDLLDVLALGASTPGDPLSDRLTQIDRKEGVSEQIEGHVADVLDMVGMKSQAPAELSAENLDALRHHLLLLPVQQLVWIDRFLTPQVRVAPEDIRKYYDEHPELSKMPRQARVRYLFLPGGAASARPQPEEEAVRAPIARLGDAAAFEREREKWRRASEKMTEIIADIELDNISFEEAIRQYSKAPNAAEGGLAEYTEGVFFQGLKNEKEISDEIMGLEPGQNSPVVAGLDGLYYIEMVEVYPDRKRALDEMAPQLEQRLYRSQLQYRYDYELLLLNQRRPYKSRITRYDGLDPETQLLELGDFHLTRRQTWALFPDFVGSDFQMQRNMIRDRLMMVAELEALRRENARNGWGQDPMIQRAGELSRTILLAQNRLRTQVRGKLRLSAQETWQFILNHAHLFPLQVDAELLRLPEPQVPAAYSRSAREALLQGPCAFFAQLVSPRFTLIEVRLSENANVLGAGNRKLELDRARALLTEARDRAIEKPLAEVVASWPVRTHHPAELVPLMVEQQMQKKSSPLIEIARFTRTVGAEGPNALPKLKKAPEAEAEKPEPEKAKSSFDPAKLIKVDNFEGRKVPGPDQPVEMKKTSKIVVETVRSEPEFDAETIERVQEVETNLSRFRRSGLRFLPIVETKNALQLFYVEPVDCTAPEMLRLLEFALYRVAVNTLTIETLESLRREQFPTDTIEIRIP